MNSNLHQQQNSTENEHELEESKIWKKKCKVGS